MLAVAVSLTPVQAVAARAVLPASRNDTASYRCWRIQKGFTRSLLPELCVQSSVGARHQRKSRAPEMPRENRTHTKRGGLLCEASITLAPEAKSVSCQISETRNITRLDPGIHRDPMGLTPRMQGWFDKEKPSTPSRFLSDSS